MDLDIGDIIKNQTGKMVVTDVSKIWITINGITRDNTPSNYVKYYRRQDLINLGYVKDVLSKRVNMGKIMATSEKERVTDYLCPVHGTKTMRRHGRISMGYIKCIHFRWTLYW